jgi:hypothetical protein
VLNLDADFELAFGLGYAPKKSVAEAMRHHTRSLGLVGAAELVVDDASAAGCAHGYAGRAFCPTPRALALLERTGATPEAHPSFDVLRRVNARAFCQGLGATLPDASFETTLEHATAKLRREPRIGSGWRVKRCWGMAGRGQRVVRPGEDAAFLTSWVAEGGVQIEPNVEVVRELGMHAMLTPSGALSIGALVTQTCDTAGAWLDTKLADAATNRAYEDALRGEIDRVGHALHAAGYFGPFGVDAFEYRTRAGETAFQPRGEINARYSMGFAVGFRSR